MKDIVVHLSPEPAITDTGNCQGSHENEEIFRAHDRNRSFENDRKSILSVNAMDSKSILIDTSGKSGNVTEKRQRQVSFNENIKSEVAEGVIPESDPYRPGNEDEVSMGSSKGSITGKGCLLLEQQGLHMQSQHDKMLVNVFVNRRVPTEGVGDSEEVTAIPNNNSHSDTNEKSDQCPTTIGDSKVLVNVIVDEIKNYVPRSIKNNIEIATYQHHDNANGDAPSELLASTACGLERDSLTSRTSSASSSISSEKRSVCSIVPSSDDKLDSIATEVSSKDAEEDTSSVCTEVGHSADSHTVSSTSSDSRSVSTSTSASHTTSCTKSQVSSEDETSSSSSPDIPRVTDSLTSSQSDHTVKGESPYVSQHDLTTSGNSIQHSVKSQKVTDPSSGDSKNMPSIHASYSQTYPYQLIQVDFGNPSHEVIKSGPFLPNQAQSEPIQIPVVPVEGTEFPDQLPKVTSVHVHPQMHASLEVQSLPEVPEPKFPIEVTVGTQPFHSPVYLPVPLNVSSQNLQISENPDSFQNPGNPKIVVQQIQQPIPLVSTQVNGKVIDHEPTQPEIKDSHIKQEPNPAVLEPLQINRMSEHLIQFPVADPLLGGDYNKADNVHHKCTCIKGSCTCQYFPQVQLQHPQFNTHNTPFHMCDGVVQGENVHFCSCEPSGEFGFGQCHPPCDCSGSGPATECLNCASYISETERCTCKGEHCTCNVALTRAVCCDTLCSCNEPNTVYSYKPRTYRADPSKRVVAFSVKSKKLFSLGLSKPKSFGPRFGGQRR